MQVMTRARRVLSKSIGLNSVQTVYLSYVLHKRMMAVLQVLKSEEDGFSPFPRRKSFDGVQGPANGEKEVGKAVWKGSGTWDHVMRLLTLELFKHLHGVLGNRMLHVLKNNKPFERSAMTRLCFTAPALSLLIATLENETAHSAQIERPARSVAEEVKLHDEDKVYAWREMSQNGALPGGRPFICVRKRKAVR